MVRLAARPSRNGAAGAPVRWSAARPGRWTWLVACLLALGLGAGNGRAADSDGLLSGRVTSGGVPLAGVQVQVNALGGQRVSWNWTTFTDANGNYTANIRRPNNEADPFYYSVNFVRAGVLLFMPQTYSRVRVTTADLTGINADVLAGYVGTGRVTEGSIGIPGATVSMTTREFPGRVNLDIPIPDNNPTGISHSIDVSSSGAINYIRVWVALTHTFRGDLDITVVHPDGTRCKLLAQVAGDARPNVIEVFGDTLTPVEPLSRFLGKSRTGTWRLEVRDLAAADIGNLAGWGLILDQSPSLPFVTDANGNFNFSSFFGELPAIYGSVLAVDKPGVDFNPPSLIPHAPLPVLFQAIPKAPALSFINNRIVNEDSGPITVPFSITEAEIPVDNVALSASSFNPGLVPNGQFTFGGSGANRTLTFTPTPNANGTAAIVITANDGTSVGSTAFTVVVNPVNDPPVLGPLGNLTINEDASTAINFTVADLETPTANLLVTATSTNLNLVPDGGLVLSGSGGNRILTITPRPNANGQTLIRVALSDGALSVTNSFLLTVTPVNDLPVAGPRTGVRLNGFDESVETPSVGAGLSGNAAHTLEMWVRPDAMFGGVYASDFSGAPGGLTVAGSASVNGGYLKLTTATGGQDGTATVGDFGGGAPVTHFRAKFRLAAFGGSAPPADGFGFNLMPAGAPLIGAAEEGYDTGLAVTFDTFDNFGGEAPALEVKYRGTILKHIPLQISAGFGVTDPAIAAREVIINLDPDGTLDVAYDGRQLIRNLPTGYRASDIGTPKWVLAARTGGLVENYWVDDLRIEAPAVSVSPAARSWLAQLGNAGVGSHHWLLTPGADPNVVLLQFGIWGGVNAQVLGAPLPVNEWSHVAATWDPATANYVVYVDGFPVGQASPPNDRFALAGVGLTLGRPFVGGESYFNGYIDEVRLWNRALSGAEIRQNQNFPLTGAEVGLQVYQRFDETTGFLASDSAPLAGRNEGTLVNGATYGLAASVREPGSITFDGVNDWISVPRFGPIAPTTEVTVEFWQRVASLKSQSTFSLGPDRPNTDNRLNAHVPWSDGTVYWDFGNWQTDGRLTYTPPPNSTVGVWQHWALVASQNANEMRIYRNGVPVAQKTGMSPRSPAGTADWELKIGSAEVVGPYQFEGDLSEFRIWNVARTTSEIQANTNRTLTGTEPGLVAYFPFREGWGTAVAGSAPYVQSGIVNGNPTWGESPLGSTNAPATFGTLFVDEDTPKTAYLTAYDIEEYRAEGGSMTFNVVKPPSAGSLNRSSGTWTIASQNPITYTPSNNFNGNDSFSYRVTDASGLTSALYTVPIVVRDANDVPTVSSVADLVIEENTSSPPISFTVFDTDNPPGDLQVKGESQDSSLIPSANIVITGTGTNQTMIITPARDEIGTTTILIRVNDGQAEAQTSFRVRVAPRPAYAILDLGTLPARSQSSGAALNAQAWTVGSSQSQPADAHAFLFKGVEGGSALLDLGTLLGPTAVAGGINDSNVITGFSTAGNGAPRELFRWSNNVMSSLGFLNGNLPTEGRSINSAGKIAGSGGTPAGTRAFLHAGAYTNLGVLSGGSRSEAFAVNESDEVVGYSTVAGGAERAFLYRAGALINLGVLSNHISSRALAINNDHQIAGWSASGAGVRRAVVTDAITLQSADLGLLSGGAFASANGINDFNQVVGQAGNAAGRNSAFLYSAGQLHDLNNLIPAEDDERWDLQDAAAINRDGFITGTGILNGTGGGTHAFLAVPAWVIGRPIARPEGSVKRLPEIEILRGNPQDTPQNSFFWSTVESRLYAIRPVTARLKWFTSFTDIIGSGTNQTVNTERIVTVGIAVWPRNPTMYVANSPTEVEPPGVPFNYSFQSVIYQTADGVNVEPSTKRFTASQPGYVVLHYLKNNGFAPRPDVHPPAFDVVRTITWDDARFLATTNWLVGTPLQHPAHFDYGGRNGYVYFAKSFYDGVGPDRAYDRSSRNGAIIPVNKPTPVTLGENNDLVVVWYSLNRLGVAWSGVPVRYSLSWPADAPKIIIASGLGSGPLDPLLYPEMRVYNQPNKDLPGYNPNEEHALIVPSSEGLGLYALRNDLNSILNVSEPFALLKHRDPATGEWRIRPYLVVTEESPYFFSYTGNAGEELQPPFPLSVLTVCDSSYGVPGAGPWWEDVHGKIYARAAGPEGSGTNILVRWFYPLQPGFDYDLARDGTNDVAVGTCLPWLDRSRSLVSDGITPGTPGVPVNVRYNIRWPKDPPVLQIGETLLNSRRGLPDVKNMAAVSIIYDDLNPLDTNAALSLARFYDPVSARSVPVPSRFQWPAVIARQNINGKEYFPGLPYALKVRLYHDPINRTLSFQGVVDEAFTLGPNPLLLPNVISPRERERILKLADGNSAWTDLVDSLYRLTRNPNRLDLDHNAAADNALLIGLRGRWTNSVTGVQTNPVPDEFGSGPKALTAAGADMPPPPARPGYGLQFGGPNSGVALSASVSLGATFTEEAWIFPQPTNATTIYGIIGGEDTPAPERAPMLWIRDLRRVGYGFGDRDVFHSGETGPVLETNVWSHLAATFDGVAYRIYVNGFLVHTDTNFAGRVPTPRGVAFLGERHNVDPFLGRIDEVRLWNVARSGQEIAALRTKRLNGAEDGLVGLWRFDEGLGSIATDAGPLRRDGTITQASWVNLETPGSTAQWGLPPRYLTLVENNRADLPGLPITLRVIRVDDGPYPGDLKIMPADNVFDERVSMRHSSDFGGAPERLAFEWYYKPDGADFDPADLPRVNPATGELLPGQERGWITYPVKGSGVNDITLGEGGESSLITLGDNWFICRFRGYNVNGNTNWSDWVGDPAGLGTPRAQLVEGWIKRVIRGLNPFDARTKDFHAAGAVTYASMILQAGPRFEGPIAFNPSADNLNSIGLIEAYTTVLNRARTLSIDGAPAVDFDPANNALLLAASRISDLYMLLGNEAVSDAQDPTIGYGTSSGEYGAVASSIFAFQNQLDSLLEEELTLLRGRDDRRGSVRGAPVYNRLLWNFTLGDGEVAYRQTYNIRDQNFDGFIDERDARILYPQGHGDAWGHYLTALKNYYTLMRHPNFTWKPRTEPVTVAGTAVEVDFLDERKFARIAAAKAKAGREIVDLTYRLNYVEDPDGQWQGYKDADEARAWGVDDWARRAGQGAYLDWLAANAILPSVDPNPAHTGIEKIDRQTVLELSEIAAQALEVQAKLNQADSGLNPIGLAKGSVPFDIDPTFLEVGSTAQIGRRAVQGLTQFDQILERAIKAVKNGLAVWDEANKATELLRRTQDTIDDYSRNVREQEIDYKSRLIEIFGYPYAGDIGAGRTYPSGYDGPDLYHYMYVSSRTATGQNAPGATNFTAYFKPLADGKGYSFTPTDYKYDPFTTDTSILTVNFPQSSGNYAFDAPASWGERRAPGELQLALSDMVVAENNYKLALQNYDGLVADITDQIALLAAQKQLNSNRIDVLDRAKNTIIGINTAIGATKAAETAIRRVVDVTRRVAEKLGDSFPRVIGLATDALAPARATVYAVENSVTIPMEIGADVAELAQTALDLSKDQVSLTSAIDVQKLEDDFDVLQHKKELEHLIRDEISQRLELYTQAEVVRQTVARFTAKLAEGQRLVEELVRFRQSTSADITEHRYEDMTFRIFRNDALQKYRAAFDVAARYVYLAANAYDYEINFLGTDQRAGRRFLTEIVRQRNLGELLDGEPVVGQPGLCDALGRMVANWEVLKPQFGVINPQIADTRFSLREEMLRIRGHVEPDLGPDGIATTPQELEAQAAADAANAESDAIWQAALKNARVADLWAVPEFRRYCRPFAPELVGAQPGLVIRFSTTITFGLNFFGWPLAGGDSAYDPTQFSTKIARAGVWFSGSDGSTVSQTPRIYLVPVGLDLQRSPAGDTLATREWRIVDQVVPPPFPIGASDLNSANWIPMNDSLGGSFAQIRRYGSFAAKHDNGAYSEDDLTNDTRLIGRSAWNTEWLMIIPGGTLLFDPNQGLDAFINSVQDIKIYFQTYSYSGN